MNINYLYKLRAVALSSFCLLILTGCPGPGDRIRLDETAQVKLKGANLFLNIDDARDYQPVEMGINLRGTPSKKMIIFVLPVFLAFRCFYLHLY